MSERLLALREAAGRGERGRATRRRLGQTLAEAQAALGEHLDGLAAAGELVRVGQVWTDHPTAPTVVYSVGGVHFVRERWRVRGIQTCDGQVTYRTMDAVSLVKMFPHLLLDAPAGR